MVNGEQGRFATSHGLEQRLVIEEWRENKRVYRTGSASAAAQASPSPSSEDDDDDDDDDSTRAAPSVLDTLLNVVRSIFPDNVVAAAVSGNILGVIFVSLFFGSALSSLGEERRGQRDEASAAWLFQSVSGARAMGKAMEMCLYTFMLLSVCSFLFLASLPPGDRASLAIDLVDVFNEAITKMVTWVLVVSPVGIASLIMGEIIKSCDIIGTLRALAMFVLTVCLGTAIQVRGST